MVLIDIAIYFFSLFKASYLVCWEACEEFSIERCGGRQKAHLVNWETIGKPLYLGRLELGNLRACNRVLLEKWLWHLSLESSSLWSWIITSKYNPHPFDWMSGRFKETFRNMGKEISLELLSFSKMIQCVVGDGLGTYFWEDRWLGGHLFCSRFPHLYPPFVKKNCFVADVLLLSGSSSCFLFDFHCPLSNSEMMEVVVLFPVARQGRKDILCWSLNPSKGFSSRSFSHFLLDHSPFRELYFFFGRWKFQRRQSSLFGGYSWKN